MSATGLHQFERTVQTTNAWLNDVMKALEVDDRQMAYHTLRAVLQALRDRMLRDEVANLGAQLPMMVRGFYYEGWRPAKSPLKDRSKDAYLMAIRERYHRNMELDPMQALRSVMYVLDTHLSGGEINVVKRKLPKELQELWPSHAANPR